MYLLTAILVTFLLFGHLVMVAFGISIPGIRIAGELVIGFLGFRMLFPDEGQITGEGKLEAQQKSDISFSPLAMPSLSGPGSIAAVITMSSSINGLHGIDKLFTYTGVVLAIIITAILFEEVWLRSRPKSNIEEALHDLISKTKQDIID